MLNVIIEKLKEKFSTQFRQQLIALSSLTKGQHSIVWKPLTWSIVLTILRLLLLFSENLSLPLYIIYVPDLCTMYFHLSRHYAIFIIVFPTTLPISSLEVPC